MTSAKAGNCSTFSTETDSVSDLRSILRPAIESSAVYAAAWGERHRRLEMELADLQRTRAPDAEPTPRELDLLDEIEGMEAEESVD